MTREPQAPHGRRAWETPVVQFVGTIAELLKSGYGKPSVSTADPGEPRKTGNATN
jgi:hypothetical protein